MKCRLCDRKAITRGFCDKHYRQARVAGAIGITTPKGLSLADRLQKHSRINAETGCMEWTGYKNDAGYGRMCINRKMVYAHRVAWTIVNGAVSEDLCVLHKCDNPSCINPKHLFPGTQIDNIADMDSKGRRVIVKGSRHGRAKLTEDQIPLIKRDTRNQREIAKDYGVDPSVIGGIKSGASWKLVQEGSHC